MALDGAGWVSLHSYPVPGGGGTGTALSADRPMALRSSQPGIIACPQDAPAAVLALAAWLLPARIEELLCHLGNTAGTEAR